MAQISQAAANRQSVLNHEDVPALIRRLQERNRELEKKYQNMVKEVDQLRANKPYNVWIVAEDYRAGKYRESLITNKELHDKSNLYDQLLVLDSTNGQFALLPINPNMDISLLLPGMMVVVDQFSHIVGCEGPFEGGSVLPVDRVLPDQSRVVLRNGDIGSEQVCLLTSLVNKSDVRPGDQVRVLGNIVLENLGQQLMMDNLTVTPLSLKKEYSEFKGNRTKELIDYLHHAMLDYTREIRESDGAGIRFFSNILYGLPGNGKTRISNALIYNIARELGLEDKHCCVMVKASELGSPYWHQTDANIRNCIAKVRAIKKEFNIAFLFIDEMDALANNGGSSLESSHMNSIVATWKTELDGPIALNNVIFIATCNNKTMMDSGIFRRMEGEEIELLPEVDVVPDLISQAMERAKVNGGTDVEHIGVQMTAFYNTMEIGKMKFSDKKNRVLKPADLMSNSDIETIVQRAKRASRNRNSESVAAGDMLEKAREFYIEKAKRLWVRVENGYRRSNSREYLNLTDQEHAALDTVIVDPKPLTSLSANSDIEPV